MIAVILIKMELSEFLALRSSEISNIVQQQGPRVVVLPVNGTRRWFMSESAQHAKSNFLDAILYEYILLFRLLFDHGIHILLSPILGKDIIARGDGYLEMVDQALQRISTGSDFVSFYEDYDVRVRFYGDYHSFVNRRDPQLKLNIETVQVSTSDHQQHGLFWGMFANDALVSVVDFVHRFSQQHKKAPSRDEIIEHYYGDSIESADIFIGMMPPVAFDFPLLDNGETALYFTTAPTPYLNQEMLRKILFDYLYLRNPDENVEGFPQKSRQLLARYYRDHQSQIFGLGRKMRDEDVWLPSD